MILKYDRDKSFFVKASPQYLVFFVFYTLYCEFIYMFSDNYETFQGKDLILACLYPALKKKKEFLGSIMHQIYLGLPKRIHINKQTNKYRIYLLDWSATKKFTDYFPIYWLFSIMFWCEDIAIIWLLVRIYIKSSIVFSI